MAFGCAVFDSVKGWYMLVTVVLSKRGGRGAGGY